MPRTKVAASQSDTLSSPSGAVLRALMEQQQADGFVKLLHLANKLRRRLPSFKESVMIVNGELDAELSDELSD